MGYYDDGPYIGGGSYDFTESEGGTYDPNSWGEDMGV